MNLWLAGASPGQALPLALVALAVGVLLVSPFLSDVSANLLASRHTDQKIADYYSADAGIEWGLWRLKNDPTLSASACPGWTPLEPVPSSINGGSFPTIGICSVSGAAAETVKPDWQPGGGAKCYPFTSSADGSVFVVVAPAGTGDVSVALLSGSDCAPPDGLETLSGQSSYTFEFRDQAAGPYKVLVDTADSAGTLMINYPVASYDLQSTRNGRTITVRATASSSAVRVISWQLK